MSAPAKPMPPRPALPALASPYKGLLPYTEDDAQFFFGRDTDTDIIAANLVASRLTLLYGPSGVGKSSVLRAGVVNTLQRRTRENLLERGEPEFIVVYFNNWKDDPIPGLLEAVTTAVSGADPHFSPESVPLPAPPHLLETLQAVSRRINGDLLIILDQFEEFFLYHAGREGSYSFANEFPHALNIPNLRANFILSFREDALAKLDYFQGRIPNLFKNYLRIKHLDLEAARQAIIKPLERFNELHPAVPPVTIEPALVDAVLSQVQVGRVVLGEAGRGTVRQDNPDTQIETPYLQLVLTRLWERERMAGSNVLHVATLEQLGGAEEIVRAHLQHAIDDLSLPEQAIAASVFDRLVTPSGTKIAQTARDLARYARVSEPELDKVLERLAGGQNRILRPVAPAADRPEAPRYEIFHDVLSGAILEWRAKYEKAQEQHKLQAELERERAEAEREAALKNEQVRGRRIQYALWGTIASLIILAGLSFFAFQQRSEAQSSEAVARTQVAVAQTQAANAQGIANSILTSVPLGSAAQAQAQAAAAQTQAASSQNAVNELATALAQQSAGNEATGIAAKATLQAAEAIAGTAQAVRQTADAGASVAGTQEAVRGTAVAASTSASQFLPTAVPTRPGYRQIEWDKRLDDLGVFVQAKPNNLWALNAVRYQSEEESGGNVNIVVTVLGADNSPLSGIRVIQAFPVGSNQPDTVSAVTDAKGQVVFPMSGSSNFEPLSSGTSFDPKQTRNGPYFVYIESADKSDIVGGMGLPLRRHVNYLLTFRQAGSETSQQTLPTQIPAAPTPAVTRPPAATQVPAQSGAVLPPDATLIFVSDRENEGVYYLYEMNLKTREVRRITRELNETQNFEPDYAPATGRFAFMRKQRIRDGEEWNIFTSDLDGNISQLTRNEYNNWHPAWSIDGKQLVFTTSRFNDNGELYVDGLLEQRMTDNPATDIWPAWSPDSKRIVFSSNRVDPNGHDFDLYTLNADPFSGAVNGVYNPELTVKPLTGGAGADLHPRWSPDGQRIVYRHVEQDTNGDGSVDEYDLGGIWIVNADGSNPHNLTPRDSLENHPAWSPDGQWIAFSRWINGRPQLFVMTKDGGNITQLMSDNASNSEPSWVR